MKRKIILSILIIITLFTFTGCSNKNEKTNKTIKVNGIKYTFDNNDSFHDMKYKFEKDNKNIKVNKEENYRGYVFYQNGTDEELFRITLSYKKDKDIFDEFSSFITKDSKTIKYNNLKWYHYYTSEKYDNTILNFYVHQNNNDGYSISFAQVKDKNLDLNDYIKTFMTNVSFK